MLYKGKRLINTPLPHPLHVTFPVTSFCVVPNNLKVWKRLFRGDSHMKGAGMLVGNFELNP